MKIGKNTLSENDLDLRDSKRPVHLGDSSKVVLVDLKFVIDVVYDKVNTLTTY